MSLRLRFAVLASVVAAGVVSSFLPRAIGEEEAAKLEWGLTAGDRFRVVVDRRIDVKDTVKKTTLSGSPEEKEESEPTESRATISNRMSFCLEVKKRDEFGTATLRAELESYRFEFPDLCIAGRRGKDGSSVIEPPKVEGLTEDQLEAWRVVFKKLGENLLGHTWTLTVSRRGALLSATSSGEIFADFPAENRHQKTAGEVLTELLSPQELLDHWAADAFAEIPGDEVRVGASWESRRAFRFNGLLLHGKGKSLFLELRQKDGERVGIIRESREALLDISERRKSIEQMLRVRAEALGVEIELEMETFPSSRMTTHVEFLADQGIPRSVETEQVTFGYRFVVAWDALVVMVRLRTDRELTASTRATWERLAGRK